MAGELGEEASAKLTRLFDFLRSNNLHDTEDALRREITARGLNADALASAVDEKLFAAYQVYADDSGPSQYEEAYAALKAFISNALETYRAELSSLIYPFFVHSYLQMVYNHFEKEAVEFMNRYGREQDENFQSALAQLRIVTKREHMFSSEIARLYRRTKFVVCMPTEAYQHLRNYVQQHRLLNNILDTHIHFDLSDSAPRSTKEHVHLTCASLIGEMQRSVNQQRIYYGLLREPELPANELEKLVGEIQAQLAQSASDELAGDALLDDGAPQRSGNSRQAGGNASATRGAKRARNDPIVQMLSQRARPDSHAPPNDRIPLPELREADKKERVRIYTDAMKRVPVGPSHKPSICFYTLLNSYKGITSSTFSDDSVLLASGGQDATVRVWSLTPAKLAALRGANELEALLASGNTRALLDDASSLDTHASVYDTANASEFRTLTGHRGAVFSVSFAPPSRRMLLSGGADGTVRLWSTQTWSNVVVFKGHFSPVWDVHFASQFGHYFASAGHDRTARLWSIDHHQPLRVFAQHAADVDAVRIHPNANYVLTGSSDRVVRAFDCATGRCVRVLTGNRAPISTLAIAPDGRYVAAADIDGRICLFDFAQGLLVGTLEHNASNRGAGAARSADGQSFAAHVVHALQFSRDGAALVSGCASGVIKCWDTQRVFGSSSTQPTAAAVAAVTAEQQSTGSGQPSSAAASNASRADCEFATFYTKQTPVIALHFTRRNLLLAAGYFDNRKEPFSAV